jgi:hypothetical protein
MSETTNQDKLILREEYWVSNAIRHPREGNAGPVRYAGDILGKHYFYSVEDGPLSPYKYYTRISKGREAKADDEIEATDEVLADAATCIGRDCETCNMGAANHFGFYCVERLAKALQKEKVKNGREILVEKELDRMEKYHKEAEECKNETWADYVFKDKNKTVQVSREFKDGIWQDPELDNGVYPSLPYIVIEDHIPKKLVYIENLHDFERLKQRLKPLERQIAEKHAAPFNLNLMGKITDVIESAINEYRNTRSPHD